MSDPTNNDRSDPMEHLAAAMAFAPNAPRLDRYDGEWVDARLDRKRGLVILTPRADSSALVWDVRQVPLTEELDALLAFCDSVGNASFQKEDGSWFSCPNHLHSLWFNAPRRVSMTKAQAAARIFAAKDFLHEIPEGRGHGFHDGASIDKALIAAALGGRVVEDVPCADRESKGKSDPPTIVLDAPFRSLVRPGDATEYFPYEYQHSVRPGMMVLCATLPENLDPAGARVEPLYVRRNHDEPGNFEGLTWFDRGGNGVPPNRRRKIGVAIAYTPKGGATQSAHNGLAFRRGVKPDERTRFAPMSDRWSREEGAFHLWHSYGAMDLATLDFFFDALVGGGGSDGNRYAVIEGREVSRSLTFTALPSWCPHFDHGRFVTSKERPEPGRLVYAVWRETPYPEVPDFVAFSGGLAVVLPDRETFLCGPSSLRRPVAEVHVVGHAKTVGWDVPDQDAPRVDVERIARADSAEGERVAA